MTSFSLEKLRKAGEILQSTFKYVEDVLSPGTQELSIAKKVETYIRELGADWAFPTNIAVGNIAAHSTPLNNETTTIPEDELIKVDAGAHIEGNIVDKARTFYFGENDELRALVETANEALKLAIEKIRPNLDISEVTTTVFDYVKSRGFKVIRNLHGHQIELWKLHGNKSIPFDPRVKVHGKFEAGEVYAIEIFVTNGEGIAESTDDIRIYSLPSVFSEPPKRIKLPIHLKAPREIFFWALKNRRSLPFSIRHLEANFDHTTVKIGLAVLEQYGLIEHYPVLKEPKGTVAQAEDTIIVKDSGAEVLT